MRVRIIRGHLRYIEATKAQRLPMRKSKSYETVSEFMKDQLALAKLNFSLNIAMTVQPFLTLFQSDAPMTFLLAKDLENILRSLTRFIKCSVITEATGIIRVLRIDVEDSSKYMQLEKVDIGRIAEKILKKCNASPNSILAFRHECLQFLVHMTLKLLERCLLRYSIVRGLSCVDPREMSGRDSCLGKLKVLNSLIDANLISEHKRDVLCAEYVKFCQERHELESYRRDQECLDVLFVRLMNHDHSFCMLWEVVSLLLLFTHGQASVKRGFSVNKQVAVGNMEQFSYISQRLICDAIKSRGGLLNVATVKLLVKQMVALP